MSTASTYSSTAPPSIFPCRNRADIAILLDASGDIDLATFRLMRSFAASLVYSLNISIDFTRVAVVTYADTASSSILLNTFVGRSPGDLVAAIQALRFRGGGANTTAGLNFVLQNVFTLAAGDRADVPDILLMLVGGPSNNVNTALDAADQLKTNFIQIISIAINGNSYEAEVDGIVSYPFQSNRLLLGSATDLEGARQTVINMLCNNIDECGSANCQHGGSCVDSINSFICFCQPPYAGVNCELTCLNPADIVFVLDGSGSIGLSVFQKYVDFLRSVINGLSDNTQVGVIVFSDSWRVLFDLNTFNDKQNIINALYAFYPGGSTNTADAIQEARVGMFTAAKGDRPNVPNVLVLVTDGESNDLNATITQAILTKKAGISILAVAVGPPDSRNQLELEGVVSYPASSNIFRVPSENSFPSIVPNLVATICNNTMACASNPCQNGGSCTNIFGGYNCTCQARYTGKNCERQCSALIDLILVIDSSGSIRRERFPAVLDFFAKVVDELEYGPNKTQVGAMIFADNAQIQFNLNSFNSKGDVISAIERFPFLGEKTNIASALWILRNTSYLAVNGGRPNAKKVAILFTDGDSNIDVDHTIPYAVAAKNDQITIFVVGVGMDMDFTEVWSIASRPINRTVITTPYVGGLPGLIPTVVAAFCDLGNDCNSSPCQQGGTCSSNFGRYWCQCPDPYAGLNCERSCPRNLNVAFVLDFSGTRDDNMIIEAFVSRVVYGLPVGPSRVSVSVVTYSDAPTVLFYLNTYSSQEQVQNALTFERAGGNVNTQAALQTLYQSIFVAQNGLVPNRANIAIVVTRGQSDINQSQTIPQADQVRQQGIEIYAVAQGPTPNYPEIYGIASTPNATHVFNLASSADINSAASGLLDRLCSSTG